MWGANLHFLLLLVIKKVSIHAPVWGANAIVIYDEAGTIVSIHAPVWGAKLDLATL